MEKKGTILLIDDDKALTEVYQKKFVSKGYKIVIAYDGLDGINKVISIKPDLVLLDILLPKLDGTMLFKKMKALESTTNIPVILLTNLDQEKAVVECFKLGAIDYLVKSDYTPQQVFRKVEDYLRKNSSHNL